MDCNCVVLDCLLDIQSIPFIGSTENRTSGVSGCPTLSGYEESLHLDLSDGLNVLEPYKGFTSDTL